MNQKEKEKREKEKESFMTRIKATVYIFKLTRCH